MTIACRTTPRTTWREFANTDDLKARYTAAVSLHAHTHHSNEVMRDLPAYIARIPVVAKLFERELQAYRLRRGQAVDFSKGWWHPPVSPRGVFESETAQIIDVLGLKPLVSITDHDNVDAGVELQRVPKSTDVPLSVEWTVPYRHGFFHVGVHNLPSQSAAVFDRLSAYTRRSGTITLTALLDELNGYADTLLVWNHPVWDLAGVGPHEHTRLVRHFWMDYGTRIHAVEFNGYRSWRENQGVCELAKELDVPVVSGGDRHGCAPNAVVNLTTAAQFSDFVHEVRDDGLSEILVLPAYREHLVTRKLAAAADVLRRYPSYPMGQQSWTDRVSCEWQGVVRPLSYHWPDGGPLWVRAALRMFQALTSDPVLSIVRLVLQATERAPQAAYGREIPMRKHVSEEETV